VTIIVPTFEREPFSTQSVQDLLNKDYSPLEIFVVDQSSEPAELPKLAAQHHDVVTYHHVSFRGLTRSRNFGWQRARYETIVYSDDDARTARGVAIFRPVSVHGVPAGSSFATSQRPRVRILMVTPPPLLFADRSDARTRRMTPCRSSEQVLSCSRPAIRDCDEGRR
jgi:glycosyltransferase involved in cell wall biosynthesis